MSVKVEKDNPVRFLEKKNLCSYSIQGQMIQLLTKKYEYYEKLKLYFLEKI